MVNRGGHATKPIPTRSPRRSKPSGLSPAELARIPAGTSHPAVDDKHPLLRRAQPAGWPSAIASGTKSVTGCRAPVDGPARFEQPAKPRPQRRDVPLCTYVRTWAPDVRPRRSERHVLRQFATEIQAEQRHGNRRSGVADPIQNLAGVGDQKDRRERAASLGVDRCDPTGGLSRIAPLHRASHRAAFTGHLRQRAPPALRRRRRGFG
jgi:hypothetical protein